MKNGEKTAKTRKFETGERVLNEIVLFEREMNRDRAAFPAESYEQEGVRCVAFA